MRTFLFGVTLAGILCIASGLNGAEPTTKPADAGESKDDGSMKLFFPYSKMTTLTADQKSQIHAIHKKMLAEIKALEIKQDSDIAALFNDEQKKEVREIEDQASANRKSKPAKDSKDK